MIRKFIATLFFASIILGNAFAQVKKNVLQVGIGLGNALNYADEAKGMPTLNFTYERMLPFKAGPGYFGAGITASYRSVNDDDYDQLLADAPDYDWKFSNAVVALRGAYHLSSDLIKDERLDVYGAAQLGARFYRSKYKGVGSSGTRTRENEVHFGLVAGARYYFTPHFGMYSEVGYDVTWFKIGFSGRF
ncbi:outer membrane beta-barrel protein [Chitinophaga sp. NPDC101104]|uniref:outer membrane beta-barrel protein n=1 Tax=Chitinophaga sp. NPDC101104 TaxID=3390561 RepID=UPI003D029B47